LKPTKKNKELEATLIIRSPRPKEFIAEISGLETIASFRLIAEAPVAIHDRYFDTSAGDLKRLGFGLRVREIDHTTVITLKGKARHTGWGAVERLEIEMPWSAEALNKIAGELSHRQIQLFKNNLSRASDDAIQTLLDSGLQIIQDRKNQRLIRNVVNERQSPEVIAELAIDSVSFQFGGQQFLLHELEIEAKTAAGNRAVEQIMAELMRRYPSELRPWQHSKLITGRAIETLFHEGYLAEFVGPDQNFLPGAFDRLDHYINSGQF